MADGLGRNSGDNAIGRNILGNHGACADNRTTSNRDPLQDNHSSPDPHIIPNVHGVSDQWLFAYQPPTLMCMIVVGNVTIRAYHAISAKEYSFSCIEHCAAIDVGVLANCQFVRLGLTATEQHDTIVKTDTTFNGDVAPLARYGNVSHPHIAVYADAEKAEGNIAEPRSQPLMNPQSQVKRVHSFDNAALSGNPARYFQRPNATCQVNNAR